MQFYIEHQQRQKMTIEKLKSNIRWWESKRWIYNCLVGLWGTIAIYEGLSTIDYSWALADTLGIVIWGIGANIFYSLGIILEILDWYYLNNRLRVVKFRLFFFIIGLLFSCFWTYLYTSLFFSRFF